MSGKDPELSRLGEALSNARSAYAAAKKVTDEAKARLNETGSRIQTFNAKITELKKGIDSEYNAMRSERAGGDRDAADEHRSMAQSMQEKLTEIYESKKSCFGELDEARAAFNKALDSQKILRDKVQEAWDGFNARLEYLKEENAKEQAKYNRLVYNVKKVLPIAKEVNQIVLETYEYLETLPDKKARSAHMKKVESEIYEKYKPRMKKLSYSQGKLLIKLVNRECNSSSYEIVQAFMGSIRAGFWQAFAWAFGASLKKEYDAEGTDRLTERVILLVESGQL